MTTQRNIRLETIALIIAACFCATALSQAADKGAGNPTGTWKLTTVNPETKAKSPERDLKLKLEGGKLTGTLGDRSEINGKVKKFEWAISDARLEGQVIRFTVTHPPTYGQGPDSTTKYEGKLTGDTLKGTAETEFAGNAFKRDFEARRVKE